MYICLIVFVSSITFSCVDNVITQTWVYFQAYFTLLDILIISRAIKTKDANIIATQKRSMTLKEYFAQTEEIWWKEIKPKWMKICVFVFFVSSVTFLCVDNVITQTWVDFQACFTLSKMASLFIVCSTHHFFMSDKVTSIMELPFVIKNIIIE